MHLWTVVACLAGLLAGRLLGYLPPAAGQLIALCAQMLAHAVLAAGKCLAAPLMLASIIVGANGLEAMRGVARLTWKTGAWIAGSSALAVLTGLITGLLTRPRGGIAASLPRYHGELDQIGAWGGEFWLGLILVALALGVYRNQIEESRGRLLLRFSMAINETLTLLLDWAAAFIPAIVFCLALGTSAEFPLYSGSDWQEEKALCRALAAGWIVYGCVLLPLSLLVFARVNPWRYTRAVGAAVLAGLAGGSPVEVFALTLEGAHGQAGISNRVVGVTLAGCAALLRDGQALGWTLLATWLLPAGLWHGAALLPFLLSGWLLGCGLAVWAGASAYIVVAGSVLGFAGARNGELVLAMLAIGTVGNAVTVFSHTCAAAVIARSEGETNLLPARASQPPFADLLLEEPIP